MNVQVDDELIRCSRCCDEEGPFALEHYLCEPCAADSTAMPDLIGQRDQARRIAVALEQELALAREVYGCAQCRWHVQRERVSLAEASERHLGFHVAEVSA